MRISFEKIKEFKVGDIFYECDYGDNLKFEVLTCPEESNSGPDNRKQLSWRGKNLETNEEVSFLITEGLEHYGPKLYDQPAYMNFKKDK